MDELKSRKRTNDVRVSVRVDGALQTSALVGSSVKYVSKVTMT
jgi:hypothetical protein